MGHRWQVIEQWQQRLAETTLHQQGNHVGGAHQLDHLQRRQAVVERQADQACLGQGEVDLDHLGAVAAQKRHPVALAQAHPTQAVGQAVAALIGLAEGETAIGRGTDKGFPLGETNRGSAEYLTHHHFSHGTTCHLRSPEIARCLAAMANDCGFVVIVCPALGGQRR
ncbi:hypothetical protein D3C86_1446590 [compost metagenome]